MKKVAFFINSLSGGGAEKILQTLLNRWNGNRWQVVVYSIRKEDIPSGYPRNVSVRFLFDALREEDGPLGAPARQNPERPEIAGLQAFPSFRFLPLVHSRNL